MKKQNKNLYNRKKMKINKIIRLLKDLLMRKK